VRGGRGRDEPPLSKSWIRRCVVTLCAALIRHKSSSHESCNPRRSELSTYKNCYIRKFGSRAFAVSGPIVSTLYPIPKIIIPDCLQVHGLLPGPFLLSYSVLFLVSPYFSVCVPCARPWPYRQLLNARKYRIASYPCNLNNSRDN